MKLCSIIHPQYYHDYGQGCCFSKLGGFFTTSSIPSNSDSVIRVPHCQEVVSLPVVLVDSEHVGSDFNCCPRPGWAVDSVQDSTLQPPVAEAIGWKISRNSSKRKDFRTELSTQFIGGQTEGVC